MVFADKRQGHHTGQKQDMPDTMVAPLKAFLPKVCEVRTFLPSSWNADLSSWKSS
jgi:hypothetical protein